MVSEHDIVPGLHLNGNCLSHSSTPSRQAEAARTNRWRAQRLVLADGHGRGQSNKLRAELAILLPYRI